MRNKVLGLAAGVLIAAVAAPTALAADVTVRVEGATTTLVPRTVVTVPTSAVKPDGTNACAGGSAGAALWAATSGGWSGTYYPSFSSYSVDTIKGETPAGPPDYANFWEFWINGKSASLGMCDVPVQQGDEILMIVQRCESSGPPNYECLNAPNLPLKLTVPAVATLGQAVTATVQTNASSGTLTPTSGASVTGGDLVATTGADGRAQLTFSTRGVKTVAATAVSGVRDSRQVCVTDGADGYCGTTAAPGVTPPDPSVSGADVIGATCISNGHDGLCGTADKTPPFPKLGGPVNGQRYKPGKAPRTLSGSVKQTDGSGVAKVELRLTRKSGKACTTYDGASERFVKLKRCGAQRGKWFKVGDRETWTYLLPGALGKGRYVLDLRVTDKSGNVSSLVRGSTRNVFQIG